MDEQQRSVILQEFDARSPRYRDLAQTVSSLIDRLLAESGIRAHSISCRLKDRDSLGRKLARPEKDYSRLEDITDLAGVRIITYFSTEVDDVASIIEKEFAIDRENSVDRRHTLDPDQFGYLSLHYVASFLPSRLELREYARFREVKFELQIRSILQHAWAEIEHDLGYKAKAGIPRSVQRQFARVAGLLELADSEFENIRKLLAQYAQEVPEAIREAPSEVSLDRVSLAAYVRVNTQSRELDVLSAKTLNSRVDAGSDVFLDHVVSEAQSLGFATIGSLDAAVRDYRPHAATFVRALFPKSHAGPLSPGIGLVHMFYYVAAARGEDYLIRYLTAFNIGGDGRPALVKRILLAFAATK